MALPKNPHKAIIPILAASSDRVDFLGTGFFIDKDGTILTAKHVFADYGIERSEEFHVAMTHGKGDVRRHKITDITLSKEFDMALARVTDPEDPYPLELASGRLGTNEDVITEEYSGTTPLPPRGVHILSYTRKGNVICRREEHRPGWPKSAMILELSYPALKGSSGAPVLVETTGAVVGMILDNVEHELHPAHVERVVDREGREIEERSYRLPTGLALDASHLRDFVESVVGGRSRGER